MPDSARPLYLQLRDQIAADIMDGRYREGELLPSVRAYAAAQGANPLTVAKAYQQFQETGLVVVRRGIGMAVAPGAAARIRDAERNRFLDTEWPALRIRLKRLGLTVQELLDSES